MPNYFNSLSLIFGFEVAVGILIELPSLVAISFGRCRYFLAHVACRNLPWQALNKGLRVRKDDKAPIYKFLMFRPQNNVLGKRRFNSYPDDPHVLLYSLLYSKYVYLQPVSH